MSNFLNFLNTADADTLTKSLASPTPLQKISSPPVRSKPWRIVSK
jgi:hypothetical protein